jgi:signal transduction histidine kinase
MLSHLRAPEVLVQRGLIPSLQAWIERARQDTATPIQTDFDPGAEEVLSVEAQVALYRVFREAIRNAVRHSGGSMVWARLGVEGESVCFSIRDDGRGFDMHSTLASGGKGYSSLQDMRIYVENVGGRLEICAAPGEGTVVRGGMPAIKKPESKVT